MQGNNHQADKVAALALHERQAWGTFARKHILEGFHEADGYRLLAPPMYQPRGEEEEEEEGGWAAWETKRSY